MKRLTLVNGGIFAFTAILMLVAGIDSAVARTTWEQKWSDAKSKYMETTGEKKPKGGLFHRTGIVKALQNLDAAYATAKKDGSSKNIKNFSKKVVSFKKKSGKYQDKLIKAMEKKSIKAKKKKALRKLVNTLRGIEKNLDGKVAWFMERGNSGDISAAMQSLTANNCRSFSRKNKVAWKKFKEFGKKEYTDENFKFLEMYYKTKLNQKTAKKIFEKYVSANSPTNVNLPSSIYNKVKNHCVEAFDGGKCKNAYKAAEGEICNLIKSDVLPRFMKSLK